MATAPIGIEEQGPETEQVAALNTEQIQLIRNPKQYGWEGRSLRFAWKVLRFSKNLSI